MGLSDIFNTAVNAVFPIILLILLGYLLRQIGFLNDGFLKIGNNLVFKVFLPAMLFVNVYDIDGLGAIQWSFVGYCVVMTIFFFIVGVFIAVVSTKEPARRGVLLQCVFRSNYAIIGLPLAAALGSSAAEATAAVVSAFTIPVFNLLAVVALSVFISDGGDGRVDKKKILLNIAKNPLILGVLAGLLALCVRAAQIRLFGEVVFSAKQHTKFLYTALNNLKSMASPFALIVLGGQFEFSAVKGLKKEILVGVFSRIVFAPVVGLGLTMLVSKYTPLLSCGPDEYPALIALFGSPVAVSSAVMARSMNNDEQLATQLVVWTSLGSMFTIFITVCILMWLGLLRV